MFSKYLFSILLRDVRSGGLCRRGEDYCSMADNEDVATSSKNAAKPETLVIVADVGQFQLLCKLWATLRCASVCSVFLNVQNKAVASFRDMGHDTDIKTQKRRWSLMRQWCAGAAIPAWPYVMSFTRHGSEAEYVRRFPGLIPKYAECSTEENGFNWMLLYCFGLPSGKIYKVRSAVKS